MSTCLSEKAPDVGTTYRLWREFRTLDLTGPLVDPTNVLLTLEDPDGYRYTVNTVRDSAGLYYGDFAVQQAGQWRYRWRTDSPQFAYEGSFVVRRSELEQANTEEGFPVRFPDVHFFYNDSLSVKFPFYAMSNDGQSIGRLDISLYSFALLATANSRVALRDELQPTLNFSQAATGILKASWTQEQVALLPSTFWLQVSEYQGLDLTDDPDSLGETWTEFPSLTLAQLPSFTWAQFPDHTRPAAIWDRTILIGRFIRNINGF